MAAHLDNERRILAALPGVQVEHIGSTAVPGLAAKPIIDLVVVVDDITAEEDHLDALLAAGYVLRVREPGHRLVRTPARDVHVHVYDWLTYLQETLVQAVTGLTSEPPPGWDEQD